MNRIEKRKGRRAGESAARSPCPRAATTPSSHPCHLAPRRAKIAAA